MFCGLYRLMISHAMDGDNQLPGVAKKHIHNCTNCREFYETCLLLTKGLKRAASILASEASEGLSTRTLTALSRGQIETYKVKVKLWPILAAACVAVIILAGVLFLVGRRHPKNTENEPVIAELPSIFTPYKMLVGEPGKENLPTVWSGLVEKPLANELDNLVDNTESSVRFLVACVAVDITNTGTNQLPE